MAEGSKITREQFDQIVAQMDAAIFAPDAPFVPKGPPVPTDCEALNAFIQAAQAIYTADCPGP